jgi:putative chitinase
MNRVVEYFKAAAPNARQEYVAAFDRGDDLLEQHDLVTPLRIAHFLAQVLHECGDGRVTFENLNYKTSARLLEIFGVGNHSAKIRPEEVDGLLNNPQGLAERVYGMGNQEKAARLGNLKAGDAYKYRGGGLMQTTGGHDYRKYGERCAVDFYGDPQLIVSAEHALKPALSEWTAKNLNLAADRNDIRAITKGINGGYIGLPKRQAKFDRIWLIVGNGDPRPAWQVADQDVDTLWLQRSLNALGAHPALAKDGKFGPATEAAVRWFQGIAGLKVDGIPGPATRGVIRLRLDAM